MYIQTVNRSPGAALVQLVVAVGMRRMLRRTFLELVLWRHRSPLCAVYSAGCHRGYARAAIEGAPVAHSFLVRYGVSAPTDTPLFAANAARVVLRREAPTYAVSCRVFFSA